MQDALLNQQMFETLAKAKEFQRTYRSLNRQMNLSDPQQTTRIVETLKSVQKAWQTQMAKYEELRDKYQAWMRVGSLRYEIAE
jgi:hypothetical protein